MVTFGFCISDRQYQMVKGHMDAGETVKVYCKTDAKLYDGYLDVVNAEITGTEKPEEGIILQGHLCHPKTSTNDNASGSAIVMEAMRILSVVGVRPRRTIRAALWGAEETGLLGSRGYVSAHFGDRDSEQHECQNHHAHHAKGNEIPYLLLHVISPLVCLASQP